MLLLSLMGMTNRTYFEHKIPSLQNIKLNIVKKRKFIQQLKVTVSGASFKFIYFKVGLLYLLGRNKPKSIKTRLHKVIIFLIKFLSTLIKKCCINSSFGGVYWASGNQLKEERSLEVELGLA